MHTKMPEIGSEVHKATCALRLTEARPQWGKAHHGGNQRPHSPLAVPLLHSVGLCVGVSPSGGRDALLGCAIWHAQLLSKYDQRRLRGRSHRPEHSLLALYSGLIAHSAHFRYRLQAKYKECQHQEARLRWGSCILPGQDSRESVHRESVLMDSVCSVQQARLLWKEPHARTCRLLSRVLRPLTEPELGLKEVPSMLKCLVSVSPSPAWRPRDQSCQRSHWIQTIGLGVHHRHGYCFREEDSVNVHTHGQELHDGHLVGRESASFVRADDCGAAQRFHGGQLPACMSRSVGTELYRKALQKTSKGNLMISGMPCVQKHRLCCKYGSALPEPVRHVI